MSAGSVAVSALLLLFVISLYRGWSERLTVYLDRSGADLWVVQKGSESFFSPSLISENTVGLDSTYPLTEGDGYRYGTAGIRVSSRITGRTLRIEHDGEKYDVYIMGFDPPREPGEEVLGGPIRMKRGSDIPGRNEIIVDDVVARLAGIRVGDEVTAGELSFTVVGISSGGNLGVSVLCFVNRLDAQILVLGKVAPISVVNYVLVATDGGRRAEVAAAIEKAIPTATVFEREEFAESSRRVLQRSVLPVLGLVVGLVFVVGATVVGLTIYAATIEREREYGVMKALGTPPARLFAIVLQQSTVACVIGFLGGLALLGAATRVAGALVPQLVTLTLWRDVLGVGLATLLMALVASALPVLRISRVDPLTVFKP